MSIIKILKKSNLWTFFRLDTIFNLRYQLSSIEFQKDNKDIIL